VTQKSPLPSSDTNIFTLSRSYARLSTKDRVQERLLHLFSQPEAINKNIQGILKITVDYLQAEAGSILLLNKRDGMLHFAAVWGPGSEGLKRFTVPVGEGIAGACLKEGKTVSITDVAADAKVKKEISEAIGFEAKALIAIPIITRAQAVGVIEILNPTGENTFAPFEISVLEKIGQTAGALLHIGSKLEKLQQYEEEMPRGI